MSDKNKEDFSGQLMVSMDGLRRNLVTKAMCLKNELIIHIDIIEPHNDEFKEIFDAFDEIACSINALTCVYSNAINDFSDLSDDPQVKHFSEYF